MTKVSIFVPTYNAGELWSDWISKYHQYAVSRSIRLFCIDSSSTDQTRELIKHTVCQLVEIKKENFNHGGTRNLSLDLSDDDIFVFMTQDALLASAESIPEMIKPFADSSVAAVCGRQLPHDDANPIARHLRLFNYPEENRVLSKKDIEKYGLKTVFLSNSFAAYRVSVLKSLGGFPDDVIFGEDMYLAAKMVLAGHKIAYAKKACVKHSHNYTLMQELKRYFDIGVYHASESWIQQEFGGAGGEGKRFIISELKYLLKHAPLWIPRACITNLCKIIGYKLGKNYKSVPHSLRLKLSMHKAYWSQKQR
jgi:rhamnosyltransferase